MGQQQLLLVILVTIIVGIATVVAINTFGSAADNANVDAVRQDITQMAAAAQGYYMKPSTMGGGSHNFSSITFKNMGGVACDLATSGSGSSSTTTTTKCSNENGTYTINSRVAGSFDIKGEPKQAGGSITATVEPNNVSGLGDYTSSGG